MQENLYEILGVAESASEQEIKSAYRELVKKHHPDKGGDEDTFKKISGAYEVLGDAQKRAQYDAQKNNPYGGSPFEDLFSKMFGGNPFGGGNPFEQRREPAAPPKILKLKISPVESYMGSERRINYVKETQCMGCLGSGGEQQICHSCGGAGAKIKTFGTGFMVQHVRTACEVCGGRGNILVKRCNTCGGKGTNSKAEEIRIKLPIGIDNGQYVKLSGLGDFHNGVYGELILQIEVEPKDNFEKMGNDLIYNLYLNYEQLKDNTYNIPHPAGQIMTKAPQTFDTSKPLRLKGKGYNGGDMYIKVHVKFDRN